MTNFNLFLKKILWIFPVLILFVPSIAYANSSWHWVTCSPFLFLPIAIIVTLAIEIRGVWFLTEKECLARQAIFIVVIANLASFIGPVLLRTAKMYYGVGAGDLFFSLMKAIDGGPYYIVMLGYLLLTLLIEVPMVFFSLRRYTNNKVRLIIGIIALNTITTALVAVLERVLCIGKW